MYVIGDPFIKETPGQTFVKSVLLVVGLVPMFYGFMSLLHLDLMHIGAGVGGLRHPGNWAGLWWIGGPFFLWGLIVLIPFRVLGQVNQRRAIVEQMAAIVLPAQTPAVRRNFIRQMMHALAEMPEPERLDYMRAMQEAISAQPEDVRQVMTDARMEIMAELPSDQRRTLMATMDKVLYTLSWRWHTLEESHNALDRLASGLCQPRCAGRLTGGGSHLGHTGP